nr:NS2a3 protein [Rabbit coronavirus HKU14]
MHCNYKITINPSSPARLEIVKLGAEKKDGFYETIVSHWVGIRYEHNPPTDNLAMIMGYCCLEVVRNELEEGDLMMLGLSYRTIMQTILGSFGMSIGKVFISLRLVKI